MGVKCSVSIYVSWNTISTLFLGPVNFQNISMASNAAPALFQNKNEEFFKTDNFSLQMFYFCTFDDIFWPWLTSGIAINTMRKSFQRVHRPETANHNDTLPDFRDVYTSRWDPEHIPGSISSSPGSPVHLLDCALPGMTTAYPGLRLGLISCHIQADSTLLYLGVRL